jgi:hypothetical protein
MEKPKQGREVAMERTIRNKDETKKTSNKKPILVQGCRNINFPSTPSYLIAFIKEWSDRCKAVYGANGHIFDDDAYIDRKPPDISLSSPKYASYDADAKKTIISAKLKKYVDLENEDIREQQKMYGELETLLMPEALAEIKKDEDYEQIDADLDVLGLFRLILKVLSQQHVGLDNDEAKLKASADFTNIYQYPHESLMEYKSRFSMLLGNKIKYDPDSMPGDSTVVLQFLNGLDPHRFAGYKSRTILRKRMDGIPLPETIDEIIRKATAYGTPTEQRDMRTKGNYRHTVFNASVNNQNWIKKIKCYNCEQYGHFQDQCTQPKKNQAQTKNDATDTAKPSAKEDSSQVDSPESSKRKNKKKNKTLRKAAVAVADAQATDSHDEDMLMYEDYIVSVNEQVINVNTDVEEVVVTKASVKVEDKYVILDSGATRVIFGSNKWLSNVRESNKTFLVRSATDVVRTRTIGDIPYLTDAIVLDGCPNIVS